MDVMSAINPAFLFELAASAGAQFWRIQMATPGGWIDRETTFTPERALLVASYLSRTIPEDHLRILTPEGKIW